MTRVATALAACAAMLALGAPAQAQSVSVRDYGALSDGRMVHEYPLSSGDGMDVRVLDYGGIVTAVLVPDRDGRRDNVVLALPDIAAIEARPNFSAIIGRYAGRLSGHGVTIDGKFHALDTNDAGIITHGGKGGFGAQLWQARETPMPRRAALTLTLVSPDGDNGFPGTMTTQVTFSVGRDHVLRLDYRATTTAPTVVNLTHHAFFNLAGAGEEGVDRQWIHVAASRYTPLGDHSLPTGAIATLDDMPLDLRGWTRLGAVMRSPWPGIVAMRGLDHYWVLDGWGGDGRSVAPQACLYDPGSGRLLAVRTSEPGMQLYTGNGFDGMREAMAGDGRRYFLRQGDGIALETQHFPDSPAHPQFPSTVLRPGAAMTSTTSFRFAALKDPEDGPPPAGACGG